MERQNLWTDRMEATLEDELTVGFVDGWCLFPTKEAVIPTRRSLMNDNFPVFGSVNRRYAELVLQRWTGTAPLSTKHLPEALTENCTTTRTTTDCQFEVQPFLAKPSDSIRIRIGPKTVTCSLTSSVAQEPGLIECPPVEHDGNLLEVSIDNGPWIKVAQVPQPEDPAQSEPTIPAAPQTLGSQASADPESVGWPRAAFWMAAISLVIATTVIMTRHLIKRGR
jgi:hypothetical protein